MPMWQLHSETYTSSTVELNSFLAQPMQFSFHQLTSQFHRSDSSRQQESKALAGSRNRNTKRTNKDIAVYLKYDSMAIRIGRGHYNFRLHLTLREYQ